MYCIAWFVSFRADSEQRALKKFEVWFLSSHAHRARPINIKHSFIHSLSLSLFSYLPPQFFLTLYVFQRRCNCNVSDLVFLTDGKSQETNLLGTAPHGRNFLAGWLLLRVSCVFGFHPSGYPWKIKASYRSAS